MKKKESELGKTIDLQEKDLKKKESELGKTIDLQEKDLKKKENNGTSPWWGRMWKKGNEKPTVRSNELQKLEEKAKTNVEEDSDDELHTASEGEDEEDSDDDAYE